MSNVITNFHRHDGPPIELYACLNLKPIRIFFVTVFKDVASNQKCNSQKPRLRNGVGKYLMALVPSDYNVWVYHETWDEWKNFMYAY